MCHPISSNLCKCLFAIRAPLKLFPASLTLGSDTCSSLIADLLLCDTWILIKNRLIQLQTMFSAGVGCARIIQAVSSRTTIPRSIYWMRLAISRFATASKNRQSVSDCVLFLVKHDKLTRCQLINWLCGHLHVLFRGLGHTKPSNSI